jgi:hypothetical protein
LVPVLPQTKENKIASYELRFDSHLDRKAEQRMGRIAQDEVVAERGFLRSGDAARAAGMSPILFSRLASSVSVQLNKELTVEIGAAAREQGNLFFLSKRFHDDVVSCRLDQILFHRTV